MAPSSFLWYAMSLMYLPQKDPDHSFKPDFQYKHDNPYHEKLKIFDEFVLRDKEGEELKDEWAKKCFGNESPLDVEIGTGYGHFMQDYSIDHPDRNFVGMDYRFKRSFNLAKKLSKMSNKNFRYLRAKGERLSFLFAENEIDKLYYFFPDPWPKRRHHKKRLIQENFLRTAIKTIKVDGYFIIKTDHDGYFEWMLKVFEKFEGAHGKEFVEVFKSFDLYKSGKDNVLSKYQTKFEKIFLKKEIPIKALILQCKSVN